MKNTERYQIWKVTLEKYKKYLIIDYVQDWKDINNKMCDFIADNEKRPSQQAKQPEEKRLATWISHQRENYDPRGSEYSKNIIKTREIWQIWTDTLQKYKKYLMIDNIQNWKDNHKKLCDFIEITCKRPSSTAKDQEEKILGVWVSVQILNYNEKRPEYSRHIMNTSPEIWQIWTATLQKYKKYLMIDRVQKWKDNHKKLCDFIDSNKKSPSSTAKYQ